MMKEMGGLMKQAQAMQEAMAKAQADIQAMEIEGVAGGDLVKVVLAGDGQMKGVSLDRSVIDPEEPDVLEDLLIAAFNDAKRKLDEETQQRMQAVAGPLASMLPPGMKSPF